MSIPFTYLIGWSNLQLFYYGCRYAINCHPNQLWHSYFTSSSEVTTTREYCGEPDIIQIRKTFKNAELCRQWEHKVLRRMNVLSDSRWLNRNDKLAPPIMFGPCSNSRKKSISESRKRTTKVVCPYCKKACDPGNASLWHFDKCKLNPQKDSAYWDSISNVRSNLIRVGKTKSIKDICSTKEIDIHAHNKITHTCPHCGKVGNGPIMKRHHFSNCRVLSCTHLQTYDLTDPT